MLLTSILIFKAQGSRITVQGAGQEVYGTRQRVSHAMMAYLNQLG